MSLSLHFNRSMSVDMQATTYLYLARIFGFIATTQCSRSFCRCSITCPFFFLLSGANPLNSNRAQIVSTELAGFLATGGDINTIQPRVRAFVIKRSDGASAIGFGLRNFYRSSLKASFFSYAMVKW